MKRIIALLLSLILIFSMTVTSQAEGETAGTTGPTEGTCGAETNEGGRDSVKWKLTPNGGTVAVPDENGNDNLLETYTLIISGKGDVMDNLCDETAEAWNTAKGGNYAPQISDLIIEEGVTSMGDRMTRGMDLYSLSIPASVKKITGAIRDLKVFDLASENKSYKVEGNTVFTADGKTLVAYFNKAEHIDTYEIPVGVEEIGDGCFAKADIAHIIIPNTVTKLGDYAFERSWIEELTIPNSVTECGIYTAIECPNLKSLTIGNGITELTHSQFRTNPRLETVLIGSGVKTIRETVFNDCGRLKTVSFANGSSLEEIAGEKVFCNTAIESIELPDSCTKVAKWAFWGCTELHSIVARGVKLDADGGAANFGAFYNASNGTGCFKATVTANIVVNNQAWRPGIPAKDFYLEDGTKAKFDSWRKTDGSYFGSRTDNTPATIDSETVLYSRYQTSCTFSANADDVTGSAPTPITTYVAPGLEDGMGWQTKTKVPECTFVRDGYKFIGWNTMANGSGVSYQPNEELKTTNQPLVKLYAQWGKVVGDTVYTVSSASSLTYTGEKQTPDVFVKVIKGNEAVIMESSEYTVTPDNDFDVGIHKGTVTLVNAAEPSTQAAAGLAVMSGEEENFAAPYANSGGESDPAATEPVTIDFNYEIKKAPSTLKVTGATEVMGGSTVKLNITGAWGVVEVTSDNKETVGAYENGVYTVTVQDKIALYSFTVTDSGDANHKGGAEVFTVAVTARENARLMLSETALTAEAGGAARTVTYTYNSGADVKVMSTDPSVAAVTVDTDKKTIAITPLKEGTAIIVASVDGADKYKPGTATLTVTVEGNNTGDTDNSGDTGNTGKPGVDKPGADGTVKTGDMGIALYAVLALAAVSGIVAIGKKKKAN